MYKFLPLGKGSNLFQIIEKVLNPSCLFLLHVSTIPQRETSCFPFSFFYTKVYIFVFPKYSSIQRSILWVTQINVLPAVFSELTHGHRILVAILCVCPKVFRGNLRKYCPMQSRGLIHCLLRMAEALGTAQTCREVKQPFVAEKEPLSNRAYGIPSGMTAVSTYCFQQWQGRCFRFGLCKITLSYPQCKCHL